MTFLITTLTLLSNAFFVVFILAIFFDKRVRKIVLDLVNRYPNHLIFIISLGALIFSLLYSNVSGFPPCELCWIQRIFMYPQVILSFMAIRRDDKSMVSYLFPMTILGTLVSLYHSLSDWGIGRGLVSCTSVGGDCSKVYVLEYGYITIPFMALTSFVFLLTVSILYFISKNDRG